MGMAIESVHASLLYSVMVVMLLLLLLVMSMCIVEHDEHLFIKHREIVIHCKSM